MTLAILSTGTLTVMMRGALGLISSGADRWLIEGRDRQAGVAGLRASAAAPRVRRLRVPAARAVIVTGTSDMKSVIAEAVLGTQDVGQGDGLELTIDLTGREGPSRCPRRGAQRHAGLEEGQGRGADGAIDEAVGAMVSGDPRIA